MPGPPLEVAAYGVWRGAGQFWGQYIRLVAIVFTLPPIPRL